MTPDGRIWTFPSEGSIIEIRDYFMKKPAMREPQSWTHPVQPELAGFSRISSCQELSELGWFDEGLDHFLQESEELFLEVLTRIHKETPMF